MEIYSVSNFIFISDDSGVRKRDLIAWYLDSIQEQIDSEEELLERNGLIEKIIDRLAYHVSVSLKYFTSAHRYWPLVLSYFFYKFQDQILVPITPGGDQEAGESDEGIEEEERDKENILLFVNPNYIVDI